MESEEFDAISFYRLFLTILSKLPLIIVFVIIALVIGFLGSFLVEEQCPVYASVRVNDISGIDNYSTQEIIFMLNSNDVLGRYASDLHDLDSIKRDIVIQQNPYTGYIDINVSETSDVEFWIHLIEDSLSILDSEISERYLEKANKKLEHLTTDINVIKNIESKENQSYISLMLQASSIKSSIDSFGGVFTFMTKPEVGEKVNDSRLKICFISAVIGGVIGFGVAFIKAFTDKKVRLSEDLHWLHSQGRLVLTIPEYKDSSLIDKRHFIQLASYINKSDESILITSISEDSGITTVFDGLNQCDVCKNMHFIKADSINTNPMGIKLSKDVDAVFIIVKKDVDSVFEVKSLDKTLNKLGCRNVYYILNFGSRYDVDSVKYLSNKKYKGINFSF